MKCFPAFSLLGWVEDQISHLLPSSLTHITLVAVAVVNIDLICVIYLDWRQTKDLVEF